jgi:hypothetical protein
MVCKELGLNHVVLTTALINAGYTKQKSAIVAVWTQIVEQVPRLPRGTRVKLGLAFQSRTT